MLALLQAEPFTITGRREKPRRSGALMGWVSMDHCSACSLLLDLLYRPIRERPEIAEHAWRLRRIQQALREQDADHAFDRIRVCRGAEPAVPAEASRRAKEFVALRVHGHAEAPAAIRAEEDFGPCALLGCELIRGHQRHGGTRQHLLTSVPTFIDRKSTRLNSSH